MLSEEVKAILALQKEVQDLQKRVRELELKKPSQMPKVYK